MDFKLSEDDKSYIWKIVHLAAESLGGYQHLFSAPLEFSESDERVHFNWPVWMRAIRIYIVSQYGEKALDKMLIEILAEIYNPENYRKFVELTDPMIEQDAVALNAYK